MIFADSFWGDNGFEVINQNFKEGNLASKEFAEFLSAVINSFDLSSSSYRKLASTKPTPIGSFSPTWALMKTYAENMANRHTDTVKRLQDLKGRIVKYEEGQKDSHKKVKNTEASTEQAVKVFRDLNASLQRSKDDYKNRSIELEKARRANPQPAQREIEKLEARAKKANDEYRQAIEKYNNGRDDFEKKMTATCQRMQEVEEAHLSQMIQLVNDYFEIMEKARHQASKVEKEAKGNINELSRHKLIEMFIVTKTTDSNKPQAAVFEEVDFSHLTPTSPAPTGKNESSSSNSSLTTQSVSVFSSILGGFGRKKRTPATTPSEPNGNLVDLSSPEGKMPPLEGEQAGARTSYNFLSFDDIEEASEDRQAKCNAGVDDDEKSEDNSDDDDDDDDSFDSDSDSVDSLEEFHNKIRNIVIREKSQADTTTSTEADISKIISGISLAPASSGDINEKAKRDRRFVSSPTEQQQQQQNDQFNVQWANQKASEDSFDFSSNSSPAFPIASAPPTQSASQMSISSSAASAFSATPSPPAVPPPVAERRGVPKPLCNVAVSRSSVIADGPRPSVMPPNPPGRAPPPPPTRRAPPLPPAVNTQAQPRPSTLFEPEPIGSTYKTDVSYKTNETRSMDRSNSPAPVTIKSEINITENRSSSPAPSTIKSADKSTEQNNDLPAKTTTKKGKCENKVSENNKFWSAPAEDLNTKSLSFDSTDSAKAKQPFDALKLAAQSSMRARKSEATAIINTMDSLHKSLSSRRKSVDVRSVSSQENAHSTEAADSISSKTRQSTSISSFESQIPSPIDTSDAISIAIGFSEVIDATTYGLESDRCFGMKVSGRAIMILTADVTRKFMSKSCDNPLKFRISPVTGLQIHHHKQLLEQMPSPLENSAAYEIKMPALATYLVNLLSKPGHSISETTEIDILRFKMRRESAAQACPLAASYKLKPTFGGEAPAGKSSSLHLVLKHRGAAFCPGRLLNPVVSMKIDDFSGIVAKPSPSMVNSESGQITWQLPDLSPSSPEYLINADLQLKTSNRTQSLPQLTVTFNGEGHIFSSLKFDLVSFAQYNVSNVRKSFSTGHYNVEPDM